MKQRTPKHFLDAHRLVMGRSKLTRKAHGAVEYSQFAELRRIFKEDDNIVGVGIAEKMTRGKPTGELALSFYVRRKRKKKKLDAQHIIPPVIRIGGKKAVLTDVHEMRTPFRALANFQKSPVKSGFSVGTGLDVHAGTVGAIVSFNGTNYMLSNAHVFRGRIDKTRISYPAMEDNGNDTNPVGTLRYKTTLVGTGNSADAALAEIDPGVIFRAAIENADVPYTVATPAKDMKIVGRGRTSGLIRGVVRTTDYDGSVIMTDGTTSDFVDQVACIGVAEGGDSGAIMVAEDTGQVVGLLFAASETEFMFTPIAAVRTALGVNFSFVNPPP
jgi:hypothetical protein